MKLKIMLSSVFFCLSSQVFALSDACNVVTRCSPDSSPVICELENTPYLVKERNDCYAFNRAAYLLCKLDIMLADAPVKCKNQPKVKRDTFTCPQYAPVAPDFCENGTIVVEKDSQGCQLPPRCVVP